MKHIAPASEVATDQVSELEALYRLTDSLYRARSMDAVYDAALDAIQATLGCDRASILLFDDAGVMQFVAWRGLSERYRFALHGHTPWTPGEPDPQPLFVPDIDTAAEAERVKAAVRAEGIRALGFFPLVSQGGAIGKFMTYYEAPHAFDEHEVDLAVTIARQVGFSIERFQAERDRQRAVEDLRESEQRFRLMAEHAPVMIWMSHPDGSCLHLNQMLRSFWAVDEAAVESFDWRSMMHPDDAEAIVETMRRALAGQRPVSLKGRYRSAAGDWCVLETEARPRFAASGAFLGMIGVNVDVTERERADAQRELLLAELNHRVKNTLAVVQAIAHHTFRDADPRQARAAFQGRLAALAQAHDLLTRSNWESASLDQIARDALLAEDGVGRRITLAGPPILLPPKQALAIAMALHELFTNAVKHGALSGDRGSVEMRWRAEGGSDPRLALVWRERDGPPVVPPQRKGFGSLLLERSLAMDLDGAVSTEFRPDGLVCTIEAPLPASARPDLPPSR